MISNMFFVSLVLIIFFILVRMQRVSISSALLTGYLVAYCVLFQNFDWVFRSIGQVFLMLFVVYFLARHHRSVSYLEVSVAMFFLLVCASTYISMASTSQITQVINLLVSLLSGLAVLSLFSTRQKLVFYFDVIRKISLLASVFALVDFFFMGSSRVELTFANPNYLALFLGVGLLSYYLSNQTYVDKIVLVLIFIGILTTGSRSAILGALAGMAYVQVIRNFGIKFALVSLYGFLIAFFVLLVNVNWFESELSGSDYERILFARIGLEMFSDNYLFGLGWGGYAANFETYYLSYIENTEDGVQFALSIAEMRVSHNDFIRFVSELGVLGLVLILVYLSLCAKSFVVMEKDFKIVLFPVWFLFVLFSLTHNNLNTGFTWVILLVPFVVAKFSAIRPDNAWGI